MKYQPLAPLNIDFRAPHVNIIPRSQGQGVLLRVECGSASVGLEQTNDDTIWGCVCRDEHDQPTIRYELTGGKTCTYEDIKEILTFWQYVGQSAMPVEMYKFLEDFAKDHGFFNMGTEPNNIKRENVIIKGTMTHSMVNSDGVLAIDDSDNWVQRVLKKHFNSLAKLSVNEILLEFMKNDASDKMSDQVAAVNTHQVLTRKAEVKSCPSFRTLLSLKEEIGTLFDGIHGDIRDTQEWKDWVAKNLFHRRIIQAVCAAPKGCLNEESMLKAILDIEYLANINGRSTSLEVDLPE